MELEKKLPARMTQAAADEELARVAVIIEKMADPDIFVWLTRKKQPATEPEIHRAATIVADRLCGAVANPYGKRVQFNLFLCGYFDSGYLGYEAAEGIDWVWEHRIDDFAKFGL